MTYRLDIYDGDGWVATLESESMPQAGSVVRLDTGSGVVDLTLSQIHAVGFVAQVELPEFLKKD